MITARPPLNGIIGPAAAASFQGVLFNRFYWQGRTQEPATRQLQINYADTLTHGLVLCVFPGGDRWTDLVSGGIATLGGTSDWFFAGTEDQRYGYNKNPGTSTFAYYPWSEVLTTITKQYTVWIRASIGSLAGFSALLSIPFANGTWVAPFASLDFTQNDTGSDCNHNYTSAGTQVTATSDTGMIAADSVVRDYAFTRDEATVTFYKDGFQHGTQKTLGTNTAVDFGAKQPPTIGNRSSSTGGNSTGGLFLVAAMWNRCLGPSEMALLHLRQLALLIPPY